MTPGFWTVLSKSSVLRAKKLGGDGMAVSNRGFPVKIWRQDVCIEFFDVVIQHVPVNKDLREDMNRFQTRWLALNSLNKLNSRFRLKGSKQSILHPYPLQQLALHEGFDHVVGSGEVPGLVSDVHRLETGRERILQKNTQNSQRLWWKNKALRLHMNEFFPCECVLTCSMSTIFFSSAGLIPEACCMVKPLKFSIRTKPLIWVSSFSSNFSRIIQYALKICDTHTQTYFQNRVSTFTEVLYSSISNLCYFML